MSDPQKLAFLAATDEWICDDYALDLRYIALPHPSAPALLSAAIRFYPLPAKDNKAFHAHLSSLWVGHVQMYPVKKSEIEKHLRNACEGIVDLGEQTLTLGGKPALDYYSETGNVGRWYSEIDLRISSAAISIPSRHSRLEMNNQLRAATIPFDGVEDLARSLGIDFAALDGGRPAINLHVGPPADLIIERSRLTDDQLSLEFHAHPSFDIERLNIAIRCEPLSDLSGRKQLARSIIWGEVSDGKRVGTLKTSLPRVVDSVLTMMMIGQSTVRRHWLVDAAKAPNKRWMAIQHFDKGLQKIRDAVLHKPTDSRRFEQGVASLLFLLGFSPALFIETDAPDLIVVTPGGQLILVECTIKIADFSTKLGKLVDRRGALSKALSSALYPSEILAVLICAAERDQIAVPKAELERQKVLLLSGEDLLASFDQVRHPSDPDALVTAELKKFDSSSLQSVAGE